MKIIDLVVLLTVPVIATFGCVICFLYYGEYGARSIGGGYLLSLSDSSTRLRLGLACLAVSSAFTLSTILSIRFSFWVFRLLIVDHA